MENLTLIITSIFITAFAYLLVPIIFCIRKKKRTDKQIKKIIVLNGICVWIIFAIININADVNRTSGAIFLWSAVAYFLMKKYCLRTPIEEEEQCFTSIENQKNDVEISEICLSTEDDHPTPNGRFHGADMILEKNTENLNNDYALSKQDKNIEYNKSLQSMRCNSTEDIAPVKESEVSSELSYREEKIAIYKDYKEKKKALKNKLDSKSNKNGFKYATLILSLLLIVSITINTNQFIEKEDLNYQNKTLSTRLELLTERLDEAEENESKYFELYLQYSDKASFLTKKIALIDGDNPYYYHTYDCEDFQNADTFLAFNTEAAKNKGYVPHSCWD